MSAANLSFRQWLRASRLAVAISFFAGIGAMTGVQMIDGGVAELGWAVVALSLIGVPGLFVRAYVKHVRQLRRIEAKLADASEAADVVVTMSTVGKTGGAVSRIRVVADGLPQDVRIVRQGIPLPDHRTGDEKFDAVARITGDEAKALAALDAGAKDAIAALLTRHPGAKFVDGAFEMTMDRKIPTKRGVSVGKRMITAARAVADGYRGARTRLARSARKAREPATRRRAASVLWTAFPASVEGEELAQEWASGEDLELAVLGARALGDEAREQALLIQMEGAKGGLELIVPGEGGQLSVAEDEAGRLSEAPRRRRKRSKN